VLAGSIYAMDIKKDKMITAYRDHFIFFNIHGINRTRQHSFLTVV
jgi:hypothetical protein